MAVTAGIRAHASATGKGKHGRSSGNGYRSASAMKQCGGQKSESESKSGGNGQFHGSGFLSKRRSVGNGRILRFVLRSLQGKTFRSAVVWRDAAALDRDAAAWRIKYRIIPASDEHRESVKKNLRQRPASGPEEANQLDGWKNCCIMKMFLSGKSRN